MTRRSTRTTTVLSLASLTTVPFNTRLGIVSLVPSGLAGVQDGLDARDVAAHLAHPRRVLQLPARPLEAQVERLLLQLEQLGLEFVRRLAAQLFRPHLRPPRLRPGASRTGS